MSEHELFEYNFPKPKDIYWCEELNDYNYVDRGRANPYAYDNLISYRLAWKAWQASASRQGYKLVPVEPTQEMLDKFPEVVYQDTYAGECSLWVDDETLRSGYKAMIGEETK